MVGSEIRRVAIAHTEDASLALYAEGQYRTGIGNDAAFRVLHLDGHYSHIAAIGSDGLAVFSMSVEAGWVVSMVSVRMRLPFL